MRVFGFLCAAWVIAWAIVGYFFQYAEGYANDAVAGVFIMLLFPVFVVAMIALVVAWGRGVGYSRWVSWMIAVIAVITAMFSHISFALLSGLMVWRGWKAAKLLGSWSIPALASTAFVFLAVLAVVPHPSFLLGLQHRIEYQYGIESLRGLAREIDRIPGAVATSESINKVVGPNKWGPLNESDLRRWIRLKTAYPLLEMGRETAVIYEENGEVTVMWGGALPGHWGAVIRVNGAPVDPHDWRESRHLADDIVLFRRE